MFRVLRYVMDDNIYINPIDNTAEVTPAANRLYNQGVEKIKRREENHQMKKYKEQRAEIMELEEKPILCPKTKDIIFKKNIKVPIKEFFEYNMEWKKGVDQRTEKERKEKEKLRHLETELELAKIKEAQERYSRNKSKSQPKLPETSKPRPQRVHELVKHVVIQPPEDPPTFKPAISKMAKELVREGKVEDRLLFMEAEKKLKIEAEKLKKLEDELKQKENQKKLKTGNDHMYKKSVDFIQKKKDKISVIESEAIKEATFKPVLCKVRPEMEERVKAVRETYDLRQEHLKSPSTEKNKEQARKDVAASKLRVQAFLERNNQKMEEREDRLFNLKLESEVQEIEEIERGQVPTNKRSDLLVKESVKYKGKDLIERQEMFLNAKEGKLEKRRREKEEQERIEDNKYSLKQTQKKKPATKARARLDQSAKTAEVSQHNISNNSLINEKSTTKAKADLKGKSGQTVEDFGKVLIEDDESEICINLLPDSNE